MIAELGHRPPAARRYASVSDIPCATDGCENMARERHAHCDACLRRNSRGGKKTDHGFGNRYDSPLERLTEAAMEYANCSEYATQAQFEAAKDRLRKAAGNYAKGGTPSTRSGDSPRGGRPRKVAPATAAHLAAALGSAKKAASHLSVSLRTIRRALRAHRKAVGTSPR